MTRCERCGEWMFSPRHAASSCRGAKEAVATAEPPLMCATSPAGGGDVGCSQ